EFSWDPVVYKPTEQYELAMSALRQIEAAALDGSLTMWRNYTGEVGFAVALNGLLPLRMRRQRPLTEEMISSLGILDETERQALRGHCFAWFCRVQLGSRRVQADRAV
ncbi:hypothetical protein CTI14_49610, partial [Methylobacterium radiotolerans]